MELDIKNLEQQDMKMLVRSLELVSARVFESVVTLNQTACAYTPEMQNLFNQWVSFLGEEVVRAVEEKGSFDPAEIAGNIGVTPATIISLALTLNRQGRINITKITAEPGNGENTEICGCLKNDAR